MMGSQGIKKIGLLSLPPAKKFTLIRFSPPVLVKKFTLVQFSSSQVLLSCRHHATVRDLFEKEIYGMCDKNYDDNEITNDKSSVKDLSEDKDIQSTLS